MQKEPTILIVEDDEASYLYLESVFKKTTAQVILARNGLQALENCQKHKISVVLMDLKMPGMDGFEATRQIKALYPDLPIIAITAYAMSGDDKRALGAGCDYYLAKPLKKELLFNKLELCGITL